MDIKTFHKHLASVRKIMIDYNDGQFSWRDATPDSVYDGCQIIEVPEAVVRMWEVAAQLAAEVQVQLHALDNASWGASDEP